MHSQRHVSIHPPRAAIAAAASVLTAFVMLALAGAAAAPASASAAKAHRNAASVSSRAKTFHARSSRRHSHRSSWQSTPSVPTSSTPTTSSSSTPSTTTPTPEPSPTPTKTTAPPPTPSPSPIPSPSDLLFKATRLSDFWLRQSAPGAITEVPDPAGSAQTVFKLTVDDDDVYPITPTENPRAEMLSPSNIVAGDEIWWSAKFFLPSEFPASTPNFVTLLQGPYGRPWAGTPPFHIEVNGGALKWQRNSTYGWDVPWEMPLVRNSWVNVLIHERFAADGWIEMWVNGQPISFFAKSAYNPSHVSPTSRLEMKTQDSSNNENTSSIYAMSYRKKGMFPSLTVYQGPLAIGKTRAAVED